MIEEKRREERMEGRRRGREDKWLIMPIGELGNASSHWFIPFLTPRIRSPSSCRCEEGFEAYYVK